MRALSLTVALACLAIGCNRGGQNGASTPVRAKEGACASITAHLTSFGEVLEASSADAKLRAVTYPGLLEVLLSFEGAAVELDGELGALRGAGGDVETKLKAARTSLESSAQFARTERDSVEKHAHAVAPLAKETQQAWTALRNGCDAKRGPPECGGVREAVAKFDAAETTEQHERAVGELLALRLPSANIARARDRAVTASKAVQAAIRTRAESSTPVAKRWAAVQKDLAGAMSSLIDTCKSELPLPTQLVAADHPDPRKLTVLVHVKPPAGVERSLLSLARASTDEDERAFYRARAEGAFGSGFFLVRKTDKGNEVLIVTNRHVVELGDRAALELADGTSLGVADVVYANPTHDLAVLRPTTKLGVTEGFAFAHAPAKDQQTVIATGFPGLVGRPSYQTTKGYVSNESFRLDDGSRPLTYVQHTAPIDPGSSGGPLTDESGRVLGVNTLKVTGREAVGLAVPSKYVLDTLRTAGVIESRHASQQNRQKAARLACLGFLAELGAGEPRMLVLEQMISNHLVGAEGLDAAAALSSEEGFEHLWNTDSVRAMRIATLVRVRSGFMAGGGPSVLETCDDVDAASVRADQVKYRVRLGNFEARELALRWEQGRWKVDGFDGRGVALKATGSKRLPPAGPPSGGPPSKKLTPPSPKR
jgi:serine protease Do